MKKRYLLFVVLTVGMFAGLSVSADEWKVGEKWIYEHEGSRPSFRPDQVIDGDRVREVLSIKGEGDQKRWLLKEQWGKNDERPLTLHMDSKKMIHQMDMGSDRTIEYSKPIPGDWSDLKTDGEKTVESTVSFGQDVPVKYVGKRLKDETVKTPAGEFKNCQHVQVLYTLTFSGDQGTFTLKTKYDYWYHSKANGMVKESFSMTTPAFGDQESREVKGTSVLKSHSIEKK